MSKLEELLTGLCETRQQVADLRENLGIELGEIQTGYEVAIENLLELLGLSEEQIDFFWGLTEPLP